MSVVITKVSEGLGHCNAVAKVTDAGVRHCNAAVFAIVTIVETPMALCETHFHELGNRMWEFSQ